MTQFPRTEIEGLSIPRMIIGTNWFMGFSHTSAAQSKFIKELLRLGLVEMREEAMAHEIVEAKEKKKAYETPLIEHQAEIAVACAPAPPPTLY